MNEINLNKPSKAKYIGVWFLNSIIGVIVVLLIDNFLASVLFNNIESLNEIYLAVAFGIIIETTALLLIAIFIYGYFKDLKISRVMPYIYVLWTLGMIRGFISSTSGWAGSGLSTTPIGWIFFLAWLILVFGFRFYFKNKDNW